MGWVSSTLRFHSGVEFVQTHNLHSWVVHGILAQGFGRLFIEVKRTEPDFHKHVAGTCCYPIVDDVRVKPVFVNSWMHSDLRRINERVADEIDARYQLWDRSNRVWFRPRRFPLLMEELLAYQHKEKSICSLTWIPIDERPLLAGNRPLAVTSRAYEEQPPETLR